MTASKKKAEAAAADVFQVNKVDVAWLRSWSACEPQVKLFGDTFGKRPVVVNKEALRKALAVGLNIFWAIPRLLTPKAKDELLGRRESARLSLLAAEDACRVKPDGEPERERLLRAQDYFRNVTVQFLLAVLPD